MSTEFTHHSSLPNFPLWSGQSAPRVPLSFDLELTARCSNDCRHCYINLPAGDTAAASRELSMAEVDSIASQAVELGALWCLVTGGEPLLRKDFSEIYMLLKRKGLLVSVFTNACLVNQEHVQLFRRYPPRDIEVSVYGVTRGTYEAVTRKPGSYDHFRRGLELLLESGVKVRLKAMVLRSNLHELPAIAEFCRAHTKDFFRYDPLLHLRIDGDARRNAEIQAERLSPAEVVQVEQADPARMRALETTCSGLEPGPASLQCDHLFHCGAGQGSFTVTWDGGFRLCASLNAPHTIYDLRQGTLKEAWEHFVPQVRNLRSTRPAFLENCHVCPLVNLCLWCPAHAHLETGELDGWSEYFCAIAHARAASLRSQLPDTAP